jgi:hypothetical protein
MNGGTSVPDATVNLTTANGGAPTGPISSAAQMTAPFAGSPSMTVPLGQNSQELAPTAGFGATRQISEPQTVHTLGRSNPSRRSHCTATDKRLQRSLLNPAP